MKNLPLVGLGLFFLMALTLGRPSSVQAQTGTPPPTANYCAPTKTPTSIIPVFTFPTYIFPTQSLYTSTPCPGGICPPTATGLPTNTPPATLTPSPTVTATATNPLNMFQCVNVVNEYGTSVGSCTTNGKYIKFDFIYNGAGYLNGGHAYTVSGNFNTPVGIPSSLYHVRWTVLAGAFGSTSNWNNNATNYYRERLTNDYTVQVIDFTSSTLKNQNVVFTDERTATFATVANRRLTVVWDQHPSWVDWAAYVNATGSMEVWLDGYGTPTPVPSVTPVAPCVMGNPDEGSVSGGGTVFRAPKIVPGSCYTIVPALNVDIPSIVDWTTSVNPGGSIGIPGVQFCVQYWDVELSVFNFNVISGISLMLSFVCGVIIYRMFRD